MADKKIENKSKSNAVDSRSDISNAFISSKLRTYYDNIVEEGTPDHLIDLLQRLDEAEKKLASQSAASPDT